MAGWARLFRPAIEVLGKVVEVVGPLERSAAAAVTRAVHVPKPVEIPPEKMCGLKDLSPKGTHELLFATKPGLPIPGFPINHSAVAFRDLETGKVAVFGRQSPFNPTMWGRDGFHIRTAVDNEQKYLNRGFKFMAQPTGVQLSPEEIERCLTKADQTINEKQSCDMVRSNCYSFSTTAMTFALQELVRRPVLDSSELLKLLTVMEGHPLKDNLSIGVLNNGVVKEQLAFVLSDIKERVSRVTLPTPEDKQLLEKVSKLRLKVEDDPLINFALPPLP